MKTCEVYSNGILMGTALLDRGDPPMGVAIGTLRPNEHYAKIKPNCKLPNPPHLNLSIKIDDVPIECAGVCIQDFSDELPGDLDAIEVSVLGISSPPYEELFPNLVAEYEAQFKSDQ